MNDHYNLGSCFYDVAQRYSQHAALRYQETSLTYGELNKLSNQIAKYLISIGMKTGDVIGVFNTKTFIGYATMLACLKVGAIYTNIDEENPSVRLEKILNACKPKLLVADHSVSDSIENSVNTLAIKLLDMSTNNIFLEYDDTNLDVTDRIIGSDPAYIMFTSGSTGTPKGVLVSHANILSFLGWSIKRYKITSEDRFVQVSPMYFDNSVFDFYTALFSGASLVPIRRELSKNPLALVQYVDEQKCTVWFSVPSLLVYLLTMRVLNKDTLQSIKVFTFGGEGFPKGELKKLYDMYGSRAKLVNVYGPTEGTCICSSYDICANDFEDMTSLAPLGTINQNFAYIIVNEHMEELAPGEKGELCLIGPNIALGYYNDAERTSKSFIQNPKVKTYRDIIYKTGDVVYEKENLLWFSGRTDNQIKHMGYRIELEEIEAALNGLRYVSQSAVIYERVKANYGKIIAYIASIEDASEAMIKKDLNNILPEYMIPNVIEIREELPKNANGKVDKKNLTLLINGVGY